MKHERTSLPCGFREEALIAVALDEADATLRQAVQLHLLSCQPCHRLFESYCGLQEVFTGLQDTRVSEERLQRAGERLAQRWRPQPAVRLRYGLFSSAVGRLCIATSARGVPLVAWQEKATRLLSSFAAQQGCEVQENEAAVQALLSE